MPDYTWSTSVGGTKIKADNGQYVQVTGYNVEVGAAFVHTGQEVIWDAAWLTIIEDKRIVLIPVGSIAKAEIQVLGPVAQPPTVNAYDQLFPKDQAPESAWNGADSAARRAA